MNKHFLRVVVILLLPGLVVNASYGALIQVPLHWSALTFDHSNFFEQQALQLPSVNVGPPGPLTVMEYKEAPDTPQVPAFPLRGWRDLLSYTRELSESVREAGNRLARFLALRENFSEKPPPVGMVIFGNDLVRVPEEAARIAIEHHLPWIVVSGSALGRTSLPGDPTEADLFESALRRAGYKGAIYKESKATNSGQNARFILEIMEREGLSGHVLLVHNPTDQRRGLATFQKELENLEARGQPLDVTVTSWAPYVASFHEPPAGWTLAEWEPRLEFNLFSEIWRIMVYPGRGFMVPVNLSLSNLEDAITLGEDLLSNPDIPHSAKEGEDGIRAHLDAIQLLKTRS